MKTEVPLAKNLIITIFFRKHSSVDDEKRCCDELNGNLYFSHGKTNSCSVSIGYVGSKSFVIAN